MPFKKTNAKARTVFIGRTSELLFFIQYVLEPEDPTYHIISISGQGGVGKSTLLSRFIDETQGGDFKDYCRVAQVNERQTTPADIMEKFAEQLSLKGDFEKAFSQYKETLRRVQSEHEAKREALWRQATTDVAGSLAKTVPVMGGVLETVTGPTVGYIWEERHYRQRLKDAERLEDPIGDLTRNFVKELNLVADASVTVGLNRIKRQRRVVLFFDTFEQLAAEAAPWLLDYFLEADISSNVVLIVAGRESIDRSTPDDPKRWLHYHEERVIHLISLERFTQDEARTYLAKREITDPTQVNTYWQLSRGLPLYLGLLTSNAQGDVDPTKDVVDNFLRWIPKQEQVKQRLAAFSYVPEQERPQLYLWLTGQPFVRSSPQDGRYIYHELARDLFCRYLYQRSPEDCSATRRALAEYYRWRGNAYAELKQFDHALTDYSRAIDLDPNNTLAYDDRGSTYYTLKEYERAFADLSRAIDLNPTYELAYTNRGRVYLWQRNIAQAKADFARAVEIDPTYPLAALLVEWSSLSKQRGGIDMAERFEEIASFKPQESQEYIVLVCQAIALELRNKLEESLEEIDKAITLMPEKEIPYFWKGILSAYHTTPSDAKDAIESIQEALVLGLPPTLLTPLYWLEHDRPDWFSQYARPLLDQYGV